MDHSKQLGEERIGKLLWKFSIPAIIGMMVNALYSIIDRIFVAKGVAGPAVAAIGIAFPIAIVILAFGLLIGIGSAASVSIRLGQQNKDEAEHIVGNAFTLSLIISLLITIIGLTFQESLLRMFGASETVLPLAKEYTTIFLLGTVLQGTGFALNGIMRSEGKPKMAMLTMLIGFVLNMILNPIFIFTLQLGIKGSALATVVSQAVTTVWVLSYFLGKRSLLKLRAHNLMLDSKIVKQIVGIGMSSFLFQLAASVITVFYNKSLEHYGGDVAVAAMTAMSSVAMLFIMPIIGINQGAQPIIGYNYGAQNFDRVKKTLKLTIIASTCVTTVGFAIMQLFPRHIMSMFGSGEEFLNIGSSAMRIFLIMFPIVGLQVSGYFQAVGKAKIATFLSLAKQVAFQLPLLLILPSFFGLKGIWLTGPISDFLTSFLVVFFLLRELRNLHVMHEENAKEKDAIEEMEEKVAAELLEDAEGPAQA